MWSFLVPLIVLGSFTNHTVVAASIHVHTPNRITICSSVSTWSSQCQPQGRRGARALLQGKTLSGIGVDGVSNNEAPTTLVHDDDSGPDDQLAQKSPTREQETAESSVNSSITGSSNDNIAYSDALLSDRQGFPSNTFARPSSPSDGIPPLSLDSQTARQSPSNVDVAEQVCGEGQWLGAVEHEIGSELDPVVAAFATSVDGPIFPHRRMPDTTPRGSECHVTLIPSMSEMELNQVIMDAEEWSTICVVKGTYSGFLASEQLPLKAGMRLRGLGIGDDRPVFDASEETEHVFWTYDQPAHVDLTFSDIQFKNVHLVFGLLGAEERHVKNIRLFNLKFSHGQQNNFSDSASWKGLPLGGWYDKGSLRYGGKGLKADNYITLRNVGCSADNACSVIAGCDIRRSKGHQGRGMQDENSLGVVFRDNVCGGHDVLEDGHFTSCLRLGGTDSVAERNSFRRFVGVNAFYQDHGVYVKAASNVTIRSNLIAGWIVGPSGGAVMLDSVVGGTIERNLLINSGLVACDSVGATQDLLIKENAIFVDTSNTAEGPVKGVMSPVLGGIGLEISRKSNANASLPTSGSAIRMESNMVWGPESGIYIPDDIVDNLSNIGRGGAGGLFGNIACSIHANATIFASPLLEQQTANDYCYEFKKPPSFVSLEVAMAACMQLNRFPQLPCAAVQENNGTFSLRAAGDLAPNSNVSSAVYRKCTCREDFVCVGDNSWCDAKEDECKTRTGVTPCSRRSTSSLPGLDVRPVAADIGEGAQQGIEVGESLVS